MICSPKTAHMSSSRVHQRPSSPGQLRVVVRVIQSRIMRIALLRMLPFGISLTAFFPTYGSLRFSECRLMLSSMLPDTKDFSAISLAFSVIPLLSIFSSFHPCLPSPIARLIS